MVSTINASKKTSECTPEEKLKAFKSFSELKGTLEHNVTLDEIRMERINENLNRYKCNS